MSVKRKTDVRTRSCQDWAARSVCTETKPDEACRWLPRPKQALHLLRADSSQNQVIPMTTDICLVRVKLWMWAVPSCNLSDLALASLFGQWITSGIRLFLCSRYYYSIRETHVLTNASTRCASQCERRFSPIQNAKCLKTSFLWSVRGM